LGDAIWSTPMPATSRSVRDSRFALKRLSVVAREQQLELVDERAEDDELLPILDQVARDDHRPDDDGLAIAMPMPTIRATA